MLICQMLAVLLSVVVVVHVIYLGIRTPLKIGVSDIPCNRNMLPEQAGAAFKMSTCQPAQALKTRLRDVFARQALNNLEPNLQIDGIPD